MKANNDYILVYIIWNFELQFYVSNLSDCPDHSDGG